MRKWISVLVSLSLSLSLLLVGCSDTSQRTYLGYIDGKYVYLSSSVAGVLIKRLVQRGDQVKEGQKLYQLDPNPQQSQLQQAEAEYERSRQNLQNLILGQRETIQDEIVAQQRQAQADLTLSKQQLKRYRQLYKEGAVGQAELDQRIATFQANSERVKQLAANLAEAKLGARKNLILAQESDVQATQAKVKELRWELSQKTMYANKSGLVFDTFYREGEFVPTGQAVLALLPPQNIRLKFFVPEATVSQLKIGESVTFTCDGCRGIGKAKIYYISPQAEYTPPVIYSRDTREKLVYRIEADMPDAEAVHYHPGQPIEVTIKGD